MLTSSLCMHSYVVVAVLPLYDSQCSRLARIKINVKPLNLKRLLNRTECPDWPEQNRTETSSRCIETESVAPRAFFPCAYFPRASSSAGHRLKDGMPCLPMRAPPSAPPPLGGSLCRSLSLRRGWGLRPRLLCEVPLACGWLIRSCRRRMERRMRVTTYRYSGVGEGEGVQGRR